MFFFMNDLKFYICSIKLKLNQILPLLMILFRLMMSVLEYLHYRIACNAGIFRSNKHLSLHDYHVWAEGIAAKNGELLRKKVFCEAGIT
jgi:hypothetical protein